MPLLTTTTTTPRTIYSLLRTLSFASKAHVAISATGIRFSVDDSRATQGLAFLDKNLFTHYAFDSSLLPAPSSQDTDPPDADSAPVFALSLPALLETLQIFGALDAREGSAFSRENTATTTGALNAAFDPHVLGMPSSCRIRYEASGHPLSVTIEEGNLSTSCELTAYEPDLESDIPFDRTGVVLKVIMRSALLYDAVNELTSLSPERMTLSAGPAAPIAFSGVGAFGSADIEYAKDSQALETFSCVARVRQSYKFAHVKQAGRAMSTAAKVSLRVDRQGVLSLQFMVEVDNGGVSFVDFRFVPFVAEDEDEGSESDRS